MQPKSYYTKNIISIWALLLLPWLFGHGIFVDGLYYGTMARNWCLNFEGLWTFKMSNSLMNPFYGHPPMAIWLQGCLFCIIGDYWWIDRLYSVIVFSMTLYGIIKIWRIFNKNTAWLPILVLIFFPTVSWAYSNNILENTVCLFSVWSVYFILCFYISKKRQFWRLSVAGILTFAAIMTKGPVGLFPIALPFILMFFEREKGSIPSLFVPILSILLISILIYIIDDKASNFIYKYFEVQLGGSLFETNIQQRFDLFVKIMIEIVPVVFLSFFFIRLKLKKIYFGKESIIFLLIALSATLPLFVSPKQMGFYILPSLPFWSLFISSYLKFIKIGTTKYFENILKWSYLPIIGISFLLMILNFDKIVKDEELLTDVFEICKEADHNSDIGMDPELSKNWQLQGYLARYAQLNLHSIGHPNYKYQISEKDDLGMKNMELIYKGAKLSFWKSRLE